MAGLAETLFEKLGSVFTSNPGNAVKTADKGSKASQGKPASANPIKPAAVDNDSQLAKIAEYIRQSDGDGFDDKSFPHPLNNPIC